MAVIENVKIIDDLIPLNFVLVSCTDKTGLVSNKNINGEIIKGLPENGLLGFIHKTNPNVTFISTGGTFNTIKNANLPVIEVSEYTGYPEMKSGLVKSLHPKIHAGILAHKYTPSDDEFMKENNMNYFDAVIVNFYPLDKAMKDNDSNFEMIRQNIDVGGPTMAHSARKAFIKTSLITDPKYYKTLISELRKNNGKISLDTRIKLAKKASKLILNYQKSVDNAIQSINVSDLEKIYEINNLKNKKGDEN